MRNFPADRSLMMSNLVKTDSPNCETETAKRTFRTASLTLPGDQYKINFDVVDFVYSLES